MKTIGNICILIVLLFLNVSSSVLKNKNKLTVGFFDQISRYTFSQGILKVWVLDGTTEIESQIDLNKKISLNSDKFLQWSGKGYRTYCRDSECTIRYSQYLACTCRATPATFSDVSLTKYLKIGTDKKIIEK